MPGCSGPALEGLGEIAESKQPGNVLFDLTPAEAARQWKETVSALGLDDMHQYQLGHGGARSDLLANSMSREELMARMRVKSMQTLTRYAKPGQINRVMGRLSEPARDFCQAAHAHLHDIILGRRRMVPPRS